MKYFNRFIKRFCYRVSKRLIRLLIFFHLLAFLLISTVSAQNLYEFKDMQSLADGGTLETYIIESDDTLVPKYTVENFNSFNDITISDSNYFRGVRINVADASRINQPFERNDVLYIRQKITINVRANSYTNTNLVKDNFYLRVNTDLSGWEDSFITYGNDIIEKVEFAHKGSYDNVIYYLNGFVQLSPLQSGNIESISYNFGNISTDTFSARIYPQSSTDKIIYYVGNVDDAPKYASVDTDKVDDYHSKEDAILNGTFKPDLDNDGNPNNDKTAGDFFSSFKDGVSEFLDDSKSDSLLLTQTFTVWSYWLSNFWDYYWFKVLIYFAITIGLFAFTFSIAREGLSYAHSVGKDKSGKTSIAKQRKSNLGG